MAKSVLGHGDIPPDDWWNDVNNHVHDALDADGHVSKVNLTAGAHVTGVLPASMVAAMIPIGGIIAYAGIIAPVDYLLCDGAYFEPGDYPALYALLEADYTPNLVDRFIIGAGNDYANHDIGGEAEHSLTATEMPPHAHDMPVYLRIDGALTRESTAVTTTSEGQLVTESAGGEGLPPEVVPHNNLPPYYAMTYIIRAK